MGDFVAIKVGDQIQKNGGNVASHFLTPDGRLIHSVTGPVSAQVLLEEATWAMEMYESAVQVPRGRQAGFVASSHAQAAMSAIRNQDRQVHELLAQYPLPPLTQVYQQIFESILGEKVSKALPRLAEASRRLDYASKSKRPILFVLHGGDSCSLSWADLTTHRLVNEFVVIAMPLREAPALSQLTGQPPYEASGNARPLYVGPLYVVAHSDCQQIASCSGRNSLQLNHLLAQGLTESLKRNPVSVGRLVRAQRVMRNVDSKLVEQVRDQTVRFREKARAERKGTSQDLSKLAAG